MYERDSISTQNKINNQIKSNNTHRTLKMDFSLHLRYGDANGKEGGSSWRGGEVRNPTKHIALILQINYNWGMSRAFFTTLSALTLVGGTAALFLWRKLVPGHEEPVDRMTIKRILIQLRKRVYSTLREISFIVNNIRTLEGDLQVRKISEVFMRDGGSGEKKLEAIEALVLKEANTTPAQFESSCNYYIQNDIEIRLLLDHFRKDLDLALEGVIETYNGPLPRFPAQKILKIQEQIIKRRMQIIYKKFTANISDEECLRLEGQIQEYLYLQGIHHEREPNQKIFLSILEHYYRTDCEFKESFEQLELEMEMFIIDMENRSKREKLMREQGEVVREDRPREVLPVRSEEVSQGKKKI